jgi:hypothetical protein
MVKVSIHRFGDKIGFAILGVSGETIYIEPKAARKIAKRLVDVARSCEREAFTDSNCGSFSVEIAKDQE